LAALFKGLEDQLQIARDDHQQVIEIMGDSTGQLANQFELLGMPERRVHLAAIGDLVGKVPVGLGELARSFGDQILEVAMMRWVSCSVTQAEQHMDRGD
jgi:hypothetical protein